MYLSFRQNIIFNIFFIPRQEIVATKTEGQFQETSVSNDTQKTNELSNENHELNKLPNEKNESNESSVSDEKNEINEVPRYGNAMI